MNQIEAFDDTVRIALRRKMPELSGSDLGLLHLLDMQKTIRAAAGTAHPFSEAKLGRWLGWAQAAVVASGVATLEEMKAINKRHSEDPEPAAAVPEKPRLTYREKRLGLAASIQTALLAEPSVAYDYSASALAAANAVLAEFDIIERREPARPRCAKCGKNFEPGSHAAKLEDGTFVHASGPYGLVPVECSPEQSKQEAPVKFDYAAVAREIRNWQLEPHENMTPTQYMVASAMQVLADSIEAVGNRK